MRKLFSVVLQRLLRNYFFHVQLELWCNIGRVKEYPFGWYTQLSRLGS